ncbi:MAG: polyribonucleotide nucleotidyltransferase [Candidatus Levybacteria bacterium]|nr:polyribonucleotide nucleotidyltransferase [Candidatus Levybacteria bacterium]
MTKKTSVSVDFAGKPFTFETGFLAPQATTAILARAGDTVVLATVVAGKLREDIDYFPLTVEYVERLYAGGIIKGSRWVKREGRPSDEAILIGRLIDRSIRPLFPKEYKNEVQVVVTLLSVDGENEPDILAINAVSAALALSPIPWKGPIGAIRMGFVKDSQNGHEPGYLFNPTTSEAVYSELDLVLSQTTEKTHMIEAGAKQVAEDIFAEATKRAHDETQKMITFIEDLAKKVGQPKVEVSPDPTIEAMAATIEKTYASDVVSLMALLANKEGGSDATGKLIATIAEQEKMKNPEEDVDKKIIAKALEKILYKTIRESVVKKKKRADGRKVDEIRPLSAAVSVLPRTHGSAIFQRGMTQALTVATLGSPRLEQLIESAEGEETKRYIHHYSMPPYSVGEAGRIGTPSRREIGHGALAERALEPVIPSRDQFPYTIRVVSEILSSNGSTSMASTCGSTLALMDAGVPILRPVAGISIGMMSYPFGSDKKDEYVLLTDILGLEDFSGDMDFKVAGTDLGITAIQLDVKILGLTDAQIVEILERARVARAQILKVIADTIPASREEVSTFAPKIEQIQIPVEKIGEVIGPGGKVIKNIIAQTGATVDVEDDGTVTVSGSDEDAVTRASEWVKSIVKEVVPGEVYEGEVKRILSFGAFVEILPGKEGMVHVSQMAEGYVKSPEEVVHIGDKVTVRVVEIDDQGRINLSMKLNPSEDEKGGGRPERRGGGERGGGFRGGDRGGMRNRPPRRDFGPRNDRGPMGGGLRPDDHPLTRQFRRERMETRTPFRGKRDR